MITVFVCIMAWKWEAALQESICCQFKRECFKKTVKMSSFHFPADYFEYIYIYMPVKLLLYIFTLKLIKISSMCASLLPRSYFFFFPHSGILTKLLSFIFTACEICQQIGKWCFNDGGVWMNSHKARKHWTRTIHLFLPDWFARKLTISFSASGQQRFVP